jgi:hypothetical protein
MNTRPRSESTEQQTLVNVIGFMCILIAPLWVYGLFFPFPPNYPIENNSSALLLVLILVLTVQVIFIRRITAGDQFMAEVMIVGFLLKLAAVSAYMFMTVRVYEGVADVFFYFSSCLRIVNGFSLTGDWAFPRPFWSTNFIIMLSSWLVVVFGPTFQALMIIFATLSYWGQYLFFRAFCIAFPKRQHRTAALFMFFLPSIVFWTATVGKDAVIFFFIGGCCYGFAKMAQRTNLVGLVTALISLGGVMLVRPHIAGMLAISFGGAYLLSRNRRGLLGMAAKTVGIPLLLLASMYFIAQARTFLDLRGIEQTPGIVSRVAEVNQIGGSAFSDSFLYRLVAAPFLLFRPFLWEVRSPQAAIAGIEALGLMIFVWRRRDALRSSLRSWRENAFVLFSWVYALEFSLMFAGAMTNFGLLARQRVMLTPLALMIVLSQPLPSVGSLRIQPWPEAILMTSGSRRGRTQVERRLVHHY